MSNRQSFFTDDNQKQSRQQRSNKPQKKATKKEYDTQGIRAVQSYKRKEKYNKWTEASLYDAAEY